MSPPPQFSPVLLLPGVLQSFDSLTCMQTQALLIPIFLFMLLNPSYSNNHHTFLSLLQTFTTFPRMQAQAFPHSHDPTSLLLTSTPLRLRFQSSKQSSADPQLQQVNICLVPSQPTQSMQPINPALDLYPSPHLLSPTKTLPRHGTTFSINQPAPQPSSSVFTPSLDPINPIREIRVRLPPNCLPAKPAKGLFPTISTTRRVCVCRQGKGKQKWGKGEKGGSFQFLVSIGALIPKIG